MRMYRIAKTIKLYRGEYPFNKGGRFYTPDKEWARQFTHSGVDAEIRMIKFPEEAIYRMNPLPEATNEEQMNNAIKETKGKGFKAFWVDEGISQPNSVYFI